jgi:hypothetical protein
MVIADRAGTSTRYRLLETLRQYGEERLDARGEIATLRSRHGAYYGERALATVGDIDDFDRSSSWLRGEWHNLRAAHSWAITNQQGDLAVIIAVAAGIFAVADLRFEAAGWATATLELVGDDHPLARWLWSIVAALVQLGDADHEGTLQITTHALALPAASDPAWETLDQLAVLATSVWRAGAYISLARPQDALAVLDAVRPSDPQALTLWLGVRVAAAWGASRDELAQIAGQLEELAQAGVGGFPPPRLLAPFARGVAHLVAGDAALARDAFEQYLALAEDTTVFQQLQALHCIACAAAAMRADDAEAVFYRAVWQHHDQRLWMYQWIVIENLAIYWADTDKADQAAVLLGHLDANHHAHSIFITDRDRIRHRLTTDRQHAAALARGAHITRDELIDWTLNELAPGRRPG